MIENEDIGLCPSCGKYFYMSSGQLVLEVENITAESGMNTEMCQECSKESELWPRG